MQLHEVTIRELRHLLDVKVGELKAAEEELNLLKNPSAFELKENSKEQQTITNTDSRAKLAF